MHGESLCDPHIACPQLGQMTLQKMLEVKVYLSHVLQWKKSSDSSCPCPKAMVIPKGSVEILYGAGLVSRVRLPTWAYLFCNLANIMNFNQQKFSAVSGNF